MSRVFLVTLLPLLLTQCATLTSGTSQSILIDVLNAPGAICRGTDNKGRQYVWFETPASTTVHKGDGPMALICEKEGFEKTTMTFDEGLTNATYGNIIIGGGIGILVDTMSGAAQEYPSQVRFVMKPVKTAPQAAHDEYQKLKDKLETEANAEADDDSCPDGEACTE